MSNAATPTPAMTDRLAPFHKFWAVLIAYAVRERAKAIKLSFPRPASGPTARLDVCLDREWVEHVTPPAYTAEDCCRSIQARCTGSLWRFWLARCLRGATARLGIPAAT